MFFALRQYSHQPHFADIVVVVIVAAGNLWFVKLAMSLSRTVPLNLCCSQYYCDCSDAADAVVVAEVVDAEYRHLHDLLVTALSFNSSFKC